jgi:hypothetical protein
VGGLLQHARSAPHAEKKPLTHLAPPPLKRNRPEPRQAAASGWALGPWLGSVAATASAALASVQGGAAARAAAPAGGEALYIDRDGNAHLGVNAGDDKAIFHAMRQMQVGGRCYRWGGDGGCGGGSGDSTGVGC